MAEIMNISITKYMLKYSQPIFSYMLKSYIG
jgi:hypothetical protein